MEEWVAIKGYNGVYEISSLGNVRSIGRIINGRKFKYYKEGRLMVPNIAPNGYYYVNLSKDGVAKTHYIHQMVAKAFIIKPDVILEVDHIDENKLNNDINNLRWVTRFYNASRSTKGIFRRAPMFLGGNPRARKVYCYDKNGILIKIYPCALEVSIEIGLHREYVRKRLRKKGFFHNQLSYYYEPIAV